MFDYIIIGAGPGGMDTAIEAHKQGHNVLLIEKDLIGGTCLNKGCIPTKALLASARRAIEIAGLPEGFKLEGSVVVDPLAIARHKDRIVDTLREGATFSLSKVNVVKGEAVLKDSHTVIVDGQDYSGKKIIIATGSQPARLNIPGAEHALTSDDVLLRDNMWQDVAGPLVIIGGGVIGIEFATILNALFPGRELTVIEYFKEILPPFDKEIAKRLRMSLTKKGVKFITGAAVKEITPEQVIYEKNGKTDSVEASQVLMATGRRPVFPQGLEKAGVEYTAKGIKVDDNFCTTAPGIYAIGDTNGLCMLAHAATAQGKKVLGMPVDCTLIPSAVFSIPECAMVGLTEDQCKEQGLDYSVKKAFFRANGKAVCMDETDGLVKIIVDAGGHILGAHIMGPHASDLIAEPVLAMANSLTVDDIKKAVHSHPTLNEIIISALNE